MLNREKTLNETLQEINSLARYSFAKERINGTKIYFDSKNAMYLRI